jgi:Rrf2 family protein
MKISTKGRYALKVMTDIAETGEEPVSIRSVAERQGLSEKYIEQIVGLLVKANLLESFRGSAGGYKLTRRPEEISVGEILTATEGELFVVECLNPKNSCGKASECKTIKCWANLNRLISQFLSGVTLKDLMK